MARLQLVPAAQDAGDGRAPLRARSKRPTPKSDKTRTVILEAAVDALERYGVRGANLSRVAEIAGVTRGCLQYYFMTADDILLALAAHVSERTWSGYEAQVIGGAQGRDRIEFAIDMVANPSGDRYRAARLELTAAARTTPRLQAALVEAARAFEGRAKAFTARLFANPALADTPQFRAARDLTALVNDWLFVQTFPDAREDRIAGVRSALRTALHAIWRSPTLEQEPELQKPRIRVKAARAIAADNDENQH